MEEGIFYLTRAGLKKIQLQYKELQKTKKDKIKNNADNFHSQEIEFDYLVFHENIEILKGRIQELKHVLDNYQMIKCPPLKERTSIKLGATVVVEVENQLDEFQIVGSLEADPPAGAISHQSPVGESLLGHRVGDKVKVSSAITTVYLIKKIKY